jgi:hypothetical protein
LVSGAFAVIKRTRSINKLVYVNSQQQQELVTETKCLPTWYKELLDVGLSAVAGINHLQTLLLRLQLTGGRDARCFAGAFGCRAGGSSFLPLGKTRSFGSFRLRRGFRVGIAGLRGSEKSSELAFFEGFEL